MGNNSPLKSPNLMRNTTFKQCTVRNQPDFWTVMSLTNGRHSGTFNENWQEKYFQISEDSPLPTIRSIRLTGALELRSTQMTLQNGREYTFSLYLKSDQENRKVTLNIGHGDKRNPMKEIYVGKTWKRYVVAGKAYKGTWFAAHWQVMVVRVFSHGKGTLWLAAPQLEFGLKSSAYAPADADSFESEKIEKFVRFPVAKSEKIVGRRPPSIEQVMAKRFSIRHWSGPLVSDHDASIMPGKTATYFRVMYDEYNLYVYVRCAAPKLYLRKPYFPSTDIEWKKILYDNSVILYVKPDFYDEDNFVFGVTPEGERMDVFNFHFSWENTDWKAIIHKSEDWWGVRFTIPFHTILQITGKKALGKTLGINLRRIRQTDATLKVKKDLRAIDRTLEKSTWFWSPDRFTRIPCGFGKISDINTNQIRACRLSDAYLTFAEGERVDAIVKIDYLPNLKEQAFLRVQVKNPDGYLVNRMVTLTLDGQARSVRLQNLGIVPRAGDWQIVATIDDATARPIGRTISRLFVPETLRLMDNDLVATVERSYYTTESQARILVKSKLNTALTVAGTLDGANKADSKNVLLKPHGRVWLTMDISSLPVGKYFVRIAAKDTKGKLVMRVSDILHKYSVATAKNASTVKIDQVRRIFLLEDKPLIPLVSTGISDAKRFHAVYVRLPYKKTAKSTNALGPLEKIKKANLLAIPWGGSWGTFVDAKSYIGSVRKSGVRVLAYMFHDEPSWKMETKLRNKYREIKALDPYRPAFFLPGSVRQDWQRRGVAGIPQASDLYCKSGYPWGMNATNYTLGQTHYYSAQQWSAVTRKIGRCLRREGIVGGRNLGTWVGNDRYHLSNQKQNRCLVYTGLANGMRFFSWWPGRPQSDELWDGLIDLKKEMNTLAPILGDASAFEEDHGEREHVHYSLWSSQEKLYLIVANPWVKVRTFIYVLPILDGDAPSTSIAIFKRDKQATLNGNTITLKLQPYDAGIYELK